MIKKYLVFSVAVLLILSSFAGCGNQYDTKTVSEVSILQDNQDQYDLTFLQIADLLDEYIHVKGKHVKRGTDKYYQFLKETALSDPELQAIPEWNAVRIYILSYGSETGPVEDMNMDSDNLPKRMTGLTIREYAKEREVTPEELQQEN